MIDLEKIYGHINFDMIEADLKGCFSFIHKPVGVLPRMKERFSMDTSIQVAQLATLLLILKRLDEIGNKFDTVVSKDELRTAINNFMQS